MLVLIWVTLLFAMRSNNANTVASSGEKECCKNGFCITPEIRAEAGLCVVILCYFDIDPGLNLKSAVWYKCDPSKPTCTDSDTIFLLKNTTQNAQSRGRVSWLDWSRKNCSIIINDLTKTDNGSYQLRFYGILNGTTKEYTSPTTTITVKGLTQKPTVMIPLTEGQQTTLTCTAPGLCSGSEPKITWMWRGTGEKDSHITGNITAFKTENLTAVTQRHSSTLMFNLSAEHHGTEVTCKVIFTNNITTEETVKLNVTYVKKPELAVYPKILNSSGCVLQSEVLTCVCISEGFPLPAIKWPLLENHTEYSVMTTVSKHTVNSTTTLTVKDHSNTVVECVSSSGNREAKENLTLNKVEQQEEEGQHMKLLRIVTRLDIIIAFFIGALLSAIICCFVRKFHRKEQRIYGNLAETLEMVTSHEHPLIDAGQAVEDYQAIDEVAAEAGGAVAAGNSDVEYSKINFSLKRKSPAEAGMTQETTETEYAEIKELKKIKEEAEERQDGEDEEELIGEDKETKCVPEEKEDEDVALYSNVKDIMSRDVTIPEV